MSYNGNRGRGGSGRSGRSGARRSGRGLLLTRFDHDFYSKTGITMRYRGRKRAGNAGEGTEPQSLKYLLRSVPDATLLWMVCVEELRDATVDGMHVVDGPAVPRHDWEAGARVWLR